jgi:hypothetical protein
MIKTFQIGLLFCKVQVGVLHLILRVETAGGFMVLCNRTNVALSGKRVGCRKNLRKEEH